MKKVFAIALLMLFLFNVGGYYFLFYGLSYKAEKDLVQRLDQDDYEEEETITLKFPITLPYPMHVDDFQRVSGEFEFNNVHYKLVKQKIEGDTLFIVCYKDEKIKQILNAFSDFAKFSNDLPLSSKNSLSFMGKMVKDYMPVQLPQIIQSGGWSIPSTFAQPAYAISNPDYPIFSPPPELVL